jgi:hypothetical protein
MLIISERKKETQQTIITHKQQYKRGRNNDNTHSNNIVISADFEPSFDLKIQLHACVRGALICTLISMLG